MMIHGVVVSSSTLRWAHYITGFQDSYADYDPFDLSANLLALDCLVDAIVYFDDLTACAQAGALQHDVPRDVKVIDVSAEMPESELQKVYRESRGLNTALYEATAGNEWYEIMSSERAPEESGAWRDGIATELAAAMALGARRGLPVLLNGVEASVVGSMLHGSGSTPHLGRCFFNDALQLSQAPGEILHAARILRGRPEVEGWREQLAGCIAGRASVADATTPQRALDESKTRVHVFAGADGRATSAFIESIIDFSKVQELFGVSGDVVEEQVNHFSDSAQGPSV